MEIFKFSTKPTLFKEVTRGNKWPTKVEEIQLLSNINIYDNLTLFKTIMQCLPRGCTDSNVSIIYQPFKKIKSV